MALLIGRRQVIKGAAALGVAGLAPAFLSSCSPAAAANVITWVGGIASMVGAAPVAKDIAEWVRGGGPDQLAGRMVRDRFQGRVDDDGYGEQEPFTNEDGSQVYSWSGGLFFAAATEDGSGGCGAWISQGVLLQLIESKAAAAMHSVIGSIREDHTPEDMANAFLPVQQAPESSVVGNLLSVDDVFSYKTRSGDAEFHLVADDSVLVRAALPGAAGTWTVPIPPGLAA